MIKSFLSKIEQTESASELCKDISILGAIYLMSKAWNDTKDSTIEKYFRLARFSTDNNSDVPNKTDETEEDVDEDDIPLIHLFRQLRKLPHEYDFIFDATIPTEEDSTKWDKDLLGSCQRDETIASEQEEEEEKEEKKLSTMSELETLL